MTLAEVPFVGRERELAQIGAALDAAAAGRGQLVMLAGEPGIGKTSLADRATALAAQRGFTVLWGRCWEAGGAPAYWPWLDPITELSRALDEATLARVLGDGAPLLGAIVPELRARLPDMPAGAAPPVEEGRFRLWRAVSALVHEAARAKPALVVLDDLHAADQSSLSLLHFVARQLRPMRVLLLASYRDVEARMDAATGDLLARIGREGTTLSLARLDRAAASRLVQERVGSVASEVEARVYDRSQGNPLFLEEMMRLWHEQGADALAEGVVPSGVRDVIRQRLDRVAAETRALLDLAAVAGDVIDAPLLAAAAGRDAAWVSARLADAVGQGCSSSAAATGASATRCSARCFTGSSPTAIGARSTAASGRRSSGWRPGSSPRSRTMRSKVRPSGSAAPWSMRSARPRARRSCSRTTRR